MRASSFVIALLSVAGVVVGWFGRDVLDGGTSRAPAGDVLTRPPASSPGDGSGPSLAGRAAPLVGAPSLADVEVEALKHFEIAQPRPLEPGVEEPPPDGSLPSLRALAVLYAVAGRADDFARAGIAYFDRGGGADAFLAALEGVDGALLADALDALLLARGLEPLPAVAVSRVFQAAGRLERAIEIVLGALGRMTELDVALVARLVALAPERAALELRRVPGSTAWDGGQLRQIVDALEEDQRAPLASLIAARITAEPDDTAALMTLAMVDRREAVRFAQERVRRLPDDVWSWTFLGQNLKELGDTAGAFAAYSESVMLNPNREALSALVELDADRALDLLDRIGDRITDDETLGAAGHAYAAAGRTKEAAAWYMRAHERDPADSEWISGLTQVDGPRAIELLLQQMGPDVMANDDERLGDLADAYRSAGNTNRALELYEAAWRKDPADHEWVGSLIAVDAARGVTLFGERAGANPQDANAQAAYGKALVAAGRRDEGIKALSRAVSMSLDWADTLAQHAPEVAVTTLRTYVNAHPSEANGWNQLANALRRAGREGEAAAAQERAASLGGGEVWEEEIFWDGEGSPSRGVIVR
ncbi:MAG: hypothetical protein KDB73_08365 [Planctomycetes bacterium]|nr:hypothetical protein [Planctomycetota bacterium]